MDKSIEKEQIKLAEHFSKLSFEERQKQGFALMCWMQGYEAGYQTAKQEEPKEKK